MRKGILHRCMGKPGCLDLLISGILLCKSIQVNGFLPLLEFVVIYLYLRVRKVLKSWRRIAVKSQKNSLSGKFCQVYEIVKDSCFFWLYFGWARLSWRSFPALMVLWFYDSTSRFFFFFFFCEKHPPPTSNIHLWYNKMGGIIFWSCPHIYQCSAKQALKKNEAVEWWVWIRNVSECILKGWGFFLYLKKFKPFISLALYECQKLQVKIHEKINSWSSLQAVWSSLAVSFRDF